MRLLAACVAALALAAGGCGSSDDSGSGSAPPATRPAEAPATSNTGQICTDVATLNQESAAQLVTLMQRYLMESESGDQAAATATEAEGNALTGSWATRLDSYAATATDREFGAGLTGVATKLRALLEPTAKPEDVTTALTEGQRVLARFCTGASAAPSSAGA